MKFLFLIAFFLVELARAAPPLKVAERERGVRQDTARQYEYMRVLNARDFIRATATGGWCGAFAKWTLLQAGYQAPKRLNVHDWLAYGQPVTNPRPGDLVVCRKHVAFYVARIWFNGQVLILGGAQAEFPGERTSVCQLWVDEADVVAYRRPVPAVFRRGPLSTDTKRVAPLRVRRQARQLPVSGKIIRITEALPTVRDQEKPRAKRQGTRVRRGPRRSGPPRAVGPPARCGAAR